MARRFLTAPPSAATDGTPPAAPQVQWSLHGSAVKVAVAGNVIVAVLFFVAVVWRIFFYSGRSGHSDDAVALAASSSSARSTPCASPRACGLGKGDLLALPVYVHGGSSPEEEGKRAECAVCISELRDGDTARILPRCGHVFHAECVDRWFRTHVTCPLCRAVVVADGGDGKACTKMQQLAV
ncbi:hypothetical protein HU200_017886 [Digitaria exilis]|uniref:RING-type domain-containing protein n=1 Tax=Digitaria exilis TaxID=1010633 RepID=A0A835F589_9POAL|nr:hypothetical protein HU200_017886 [Digitaria exilis]